MNVARVEFQNRMDGVKQYMAFRKVGGELEARVSSKFSYMRLLKKKSFLRFSLTSYLLTSHNRIPSRTKTKKMRRKFIEQIIKYPFPYASHESLSKIPKSDLYVIFM